MKKLLLFLPLLWVFSSCTSTYYLCRTNHPTQLRADKNNFKSILTIPEGKYILIKEEKHITKAEYGNHKGYISSYAVSDKVPVKSSDLKYLKFDSRDSTYVLYGKKYKFMPSENKN